MDKPLQKIIDIVHNLHEQPTMNLGAGKIAGTAEAGDDPPVRLKKKRKPTPVGRYGTRRTWRQNGGAN